MPAARGSTATLTMLWRNLSSIRGQTHKKMMSICFCTIIRPQTGQMPGINEGKKRVNLP